MFTVYSGLSYKNREPLGRLNDGIVSQEKEVLGKDVGLINDEAFLLPFYEHISLQEGPLI